jgi:catechol 2,3-dioxygenase-like lactoylglutathione lyase family enzyme
MKDVVAELARGRASDPLARATALDHVSLETPDLDAAARFYEDFGLTTATRDEGTLRLRAADGAPCVLALERGPRARLRAIALRVDDAIALRPLASLPEASPVEPRPGGGMQVRLVGPEGLHVVAISGVSAAAARPRRTALAHNGVDDKPRVGRPIRVPHAPSAVARIGHAIVDTPRPAATVLWLMRTFGMIASDVQTLGDVPAVTFLRCDRGPTPTDHHTIAVALGVRVGLGHVAFEVEDLDEVGAGAAWLESRGHVRAWGIGRHLLGSQIFDYWRAPDGTLVEHYADGDLLDASAPTGFSPFAGSSLLQWGPRPPRGFGAPAPSLHLLRDAARAVGPRDVPTFVRALRALSR